MDSQTQELILDLIDDLNRETWGERAKRYQIVEPFVFPEARQK